MKLIFAFLKLIRWPNLVFIILAQVLFEYCILRPLFVNASVVNNVHGVYFILVVLVYALIAASGYIINDYFDLNIDLINRPEKVVVSKTISRRWVLFWHVLFSVIAIGCSMYIDTHTASKFVTITAVICIILLFFIPLISRKKTCGVM